MKRVIHTLFLVCTTGLLFAQQDGKKGADVIGGTAIIPASGNTYALIIGISKYADKQIKQLKYADRDAKTFEEFLKSKAGGEVRDSNIRTFYNQEATAINITQKGYRWLMNRAKNPGDRVYIYFSGHGDAASEAEMFLLAYDVIAGDAYNYSAHGALQVFNLKQRIRELSARGVQVILITDACRTNETNPISDVPNYYSRRIMEENAGEIQFISCSVNESSYEDTCWGNGRGVFSYHLIEGLMGLADTDGDNQVTVYELFKYTDEHVRADRKDRITGKPLQRPAFCCTEKEENVLALVDSDTKDKLLASKAQKGRSNLPLAQAKGILSITQSNDSSLIRLYNRFRDAIDHENLFKPEKNNALYFYHQIAENPAASPYLEDLKIDLIALLSDKGQKAIEIYLKGSDSLFTPSYFSDASLNFRHALSLIDTSDEYYSIFKSRQLFLEAKSYTGENQYREKAFYLMMQALKMDSSQAYIHKGLADLYYSFRTYDKAEYYYLNTIRMAPKWHVPYDDLALLYLDLGKNEKSIQYGKKAYDIGKGLISLHNIGVAYGSMDKKDSAMYYFNKVLSIDSSYTYSLLGLYWIYKKDNDENKMIELLLKAYNSDTTHFRTLMYLGDYYYQTENYQDAFEWYDYCSKLYPDNAEVMTNKGYMKDLMKDYSKAINFYLKAIQLDDHYTPAYNKIGLLYVTIERYEKAIPYFKKPLSFDSEYVPHSLAYTYYKLNYYDSAKTILNLILQRNPNDDYSLFLYGHIYFEEDKLSDAVKMFSLAHTITPSNPDYIDNIAGSYYAMDEWDSSIVYYYRLIEIDTLAFNGYLGLWKIAFHQSKDYNEAARIMQHAIDVGLEGHQCAPYIIYAKIANGEYLEAVHIANALGTQYPNYPYLQFYYLAFIDVAQNNEVGFCENIQEALNKGLPCSFVTPGITDYMDKMLEHTRVKEIIKTHCQ